MSAAYWLWVPELIVTTLLFGLHWMFPKGSVILTWYVWVDPGVRPVSRNPPLGRVQKF